MIGNLVLLMLVTLPVEGEGGEGQPARGDLLTTISRGASKAQDPTPVLRAIETLLAQPKQDRFVASSTISEWLAVVEDSGANTMVRSATLRLVCETVNAEGAPRVLDTVKGLVDEWNKARAGERPGAALFDAPPIIRTFLLAGAKRIAELLPGEKGLLNVLLDITTDETMQYEDIRIACCERISDYPESIQLRQHYMLAAVAVRPNWPAPGCFSELVNDHVIDSLREIAFDPEPETERGINIPALDLLAEYGDLESILLLEEWARDQGVQMESLRGVGGHYWEIRSQHHPTLLLDHIRDDDWINHQTRRWALGKAIKLGLEKSTIRSALLEHASKIGDNDALRYDWQQLKKLAIENGVVAASELPEVPEPEFSFKY